MGNKNLRLNRLINLLKLRHAVSIHELSALLDVSEMTIRRDLKILEQNSIAENVNGVMFYNPSHAVVQSDSKYILGLENERQTEEKTDIGIFAASLVEPDDVIIIDTGTTTEKIARNLPPDRKFTVLCYNMNILIELRRNPNINILFAGGHYHTNTQMFESPQGIEFINSIRVQKAFISAAGIHKALGITCVNSYEVDTKKAILRNSVEKILVADSTKFGVVHSCYFCELDEINTVVTNKNLSQEWIDLLNTMGKKIYLV